MKACRIGDRTFADVSGEGRGNIGAIELSDYTLIIDSTLFPSTAASFRKSLEAQIKSPIRKLLLTHYHVDHVFGNQIFKDCEIVSSHQLLKLMEDGVSDFQLSDSDVRERPELAELRNLKATFPTLTFEEALSLRDDGFEVRMIRVGGHTKDSSFIHFPEENTLFSGDLIFAGEFPWAGDKTCNPQEWMDALRLFKQLDADQIIPGHGPICDQSEIDRYLEFFEETTSMLQILISDGFTKKEVQEYKDFPSFYTHEREVRTYERRSGTLARWYDFYKQELEE